MATNAAIRFHHTNSWGSMINQARGELGRDPIVWWNLIAAFVAMFALVLPAGNAHDSDCHARLVLPPSGRGSFTFRVRPDDPTDSFVELYADRRARIEARLLPPGLEPSPGATGDAAWVHRDAQGLSQCALVNVDANPASSQITSRVATLLFSARTADETRQAVEQARSAYEALQQGRIDRARFTDNANAYFSAAAVADFAASLGPLGQPDSFTLSGQSRRGGLVFRSFTVTYAGRRTLRLTVFVAPDGKFEQYQIAAVD